MKNLLGLLLLGAAGVMVWHVLKRKLHPSGGLMVTLMQDLPAGAQLTGNIQSTTNTEPPDGSQEVLGFALKDWAEVIMPDGQHRWIEVQVK